MATFSKTVTFKGESHEVSIEVNLSENNVYVWKQFDLTSKIIAATSIHPNMSSTFFSLIKNLRDYFIAQTNVDNLTQHLQEWDGKLD
jgi:hypothetical protein